MFEKFRQDKENIDINEELDTAQKRYDASKAAYEGMGSPEKGFASQGREWSQGDYDRFKANIEKDRVALNEIREEMGMPLQEKEY